jgi:hypothetical protein
MIKRVLSVQRPRASETGFAAHCGAIMAERKMAPVPRQFVKRTAANWRAMSAKAA